MVYYIFAFFIKLHFLLNSKFSNDCEMTPKPFSEAVLEPYI